MPIKQADLYFMAVLGLLIMGEFTADLITLYDQRKWQKEARITCPNRIFTFSFCPSFVTLVTRAQNIRKFNLCGSQYASSFPRSLSLFYSSSLVFSCWICLFSFVVDFDFYGCQRALKVAKRVTLHSIPLRLWRVFNSPVNRLQSRVANWNSA